MKPLVIVAALAILFFSLDAYATNPKCPILSAEQYTAELRERLGHRLRVHRSASELFKQEVVVVKADGSVVRGQLVQGPNTEAVYVTYMRDDHMVIESVPVDKVSGVMRPADYVAQETQLAQRQLAGLKDQEVVLVRPKQPEVRGHLIFEDNQPLVQNGKVQLIDGNGTIHEIPVEEIGTQRAIVSAPGARGKIVGQGGGRGGNSVSGEIEVLPKPGSAAQTPPAPPGPVAPQPRAKLSPEYQAAVDHIRSPPHEGAAIQDRVVQSAEEVLHDYQRAGRKVPDIEPGGGSKAMREQIRRERTALDGEFIQTGRGEVYRPGGYRDYASKHVEVEYPRAVQRELPRENFVQGQSGNPIQLITVTEDGKKVEKIFRPLRASNQVKQVQVSVAARTTRAAARLNETMGLQTVPRARIARVNGEVGIVSDLAPGRQPGTGFRSAHIDPRSLADTHAFELWIGQADGHLTNFNVFQGAHGESRIMMFDHNGAFSEGLPFFVKRMRPKFGYTLPDQYSREFIDSLRRMTPDRIRATVGHDLTPQELEGLFLRRDVILKDVELRQAAGEKVFLE